MRERENKPVIAALFYAEDNKIENSSQGSLQISTGGELMQGTAIAPLCLQGIDSD